MCWYPKQVGLFRFQKKRVFWMGMSAGILHKSIVRSRLPVLLSTLWWRNEFHEILREGISRLLRFLWIRLRKKTLYWMMMNRRDRWCSSFEIVVMTSREARERQQKSQNRQSVSNPLHWVCVMTNRERSARIASMYAAIIKLSNENVVFGNGFDS